MDPTALRQGRGEEAAARVANEHTYARSSAIHTGKYTIEKWETSGNQRCEKRNRIGAQKPNDALTAYICIQLISLGSAKISTR